MAWVTWRQHRTALAGVATMFGVAAVHFLITGLQMAHAYAAVAACHPAGKGMCWQLAGNFLDTYAPGVGYVLDLLQVIPALIGVFVAAPVFAPPGRVMSRVNRAEGPYTTPVDGSAPLRPGVGRPGWYTSGWRAAVTVPGRVAGWGSLLGFGRSGSLAPLILRPSQRRQPL
jgi:hypothetical protein